MKKRILGLVSLGTIGVFLLASCGTEYYRISGFLPTAKAADETEPRTICIKRVFLSGGTKYYRDMGGIITKPPPHIENLEEYLTNAATDYLRVSRLFAEVTNEGDTDYVLNGELSSFYLAIRTPSGWIILGIAGAAVLGIGTVALGIYFIINIASCSEIVIPGWVGWAMAGGAAASTTGIVGGFVSEYLASELVMNYDLVDGEGKTVLSGSYTGYAEEADLENYNGVVAAATNDCLESLTIDLSSAFAPVVNLGSE